MLVYPQNYVAPTPPEDLTLTPTQRADVKTQMQDFLNSKTEPLLLSDVLDKAHRQLTKINIHVRRRELKEIALEIQNEWGFYEYPTVGTVEVSEDPE